MQRRLRQKVRFAEQQKRRQHHRQRAEVEEAEAPVMRQIARVFGHQVLVQHLPRGIGEVGQLQQQEAHEEVRVDPVEANHRCAAYRHQCCDQRPRVEAPVQRVFDQGHVQRREDGEQQHLRHRQHAKAQVQADVGHAELQRADQQHAAHEPRLHRTPASQRDEHQPGQHHTHQHREVTVDMPGQVFADQTEGKRLDKRDKK